MVIKTFQNSAFVSHLTPKFERNYDHGEIFQCTRKLFIPLIYFIHSLCGSLASIV